MVEYAVLLFRGSSWYIVTTTEDEGEELYTEIPNSSGVNGLAILNRIGNSGWEVVANGIIDESFIIKRNTDI